MFTNVIKIGPDALDDCAERLAELSNRITCLISDSTNYNDHGKFPESTSCVIQELDNISYLLREMVDNTGIMLHSTADTFRKQDEELANGLASGGSQSSVDGIHELVGSNEGTQGSVNDAADLIGLLGNIVGAGDDIEGFGFASSSLSLASELTEIIAGGSQTKKERFISVEGVFSSFAKVVGEGAEWLGNSKVAGAANLISAAVGTVKDIAGAYGQYWGEWLRSAHEVIENVGDYAQAILDFQNLGNSDWSSLSSREAAKELGPVVALFSMGTTAIGDIAVFSRDGVFDINDYGNTLLDSGVTAADTLLKTFSLGIVDIDSSRAVSIFTENASKAAGFINSTGAPAFFKGVMWLPGAAVTAVVSTGEVIGDYCYQFGKKIYNVINWFR